MIITIAMEPACVSTTAITDSTKRNDAEALLSAVARENAVVLATTAMNFADALRDAVLSLDTNRGQILQLLVAEILKSPETTIEIGVCDTCADGEESALNLASRVPADIYVCLNEDEAAIAANLSKFGVEVCCIGQYQRSGSESQRRGWQRPVRLDQLESTEGCEAVGRAIMLGREIIVVDRYIGIKSKRGRVSDLDRFAKGIMFLVSCWEAKSCYSHCGRPVVRVISAAGSTGARGGYVDPVSAETHNQEGCR